jgi:hypothetical protein
LADAVRRIGRFSQTATAMTPAGLDQILSFFFR